MTRKQSRQTPALVPRPPKLVEHIEWIRLHWRNYKPTLFFAAIFLISGAVWGGAEIGGRIFKGPAQSISKKDGAGAPTPNTNLPDKRGGQALRVQFADGQAAYVNMHLSYALRREAAVHVFTNFQSQEAAAAELIEAVRSAAFRVLERKSLMDARLSRGAIETEIINMVRPAQERTGHEIRQLSITEIETAK